MRNYNLDKFRGFTIISMVLFHLMYNINFYWNVPRYDDTLLNKIRQLSIAISFFVISGITSNFLTSAKNIRRGIITSGLGFVISIITYLAAPDQFILRGVLNGLGISMMIIGLIQKYFDLSYRWMILFFILFIITYKIPQGILYDNTFFKTLYDNNMFYLGFPSREFSSTDYFPIIPRLFIFIAGYLVGKYLKANNFFNKYGNYSLLSKIGNYSMPIYLIHQIILYPLITLIYNLIR